MVKNKNEKNSHSNSNKKQEAKKKQAIKLRTEWTEFCKITTNEELIKSPDEKIMNKNLNGVNDIINSNIESVSERGIWTPDIWIMIPMF